MAVLSLFLSLFLFSTSQAVSNFLDLLPLMLSLFPVELHLGDSLNREQPPFISGFFSFVFLFFSFFLFFHTFYLCCRRVVFIRVILFFFYFYYRLFPRLPAGWTQKEAISQSSPLPPLSLSRSGQNPFYPVYEIEIGSSSETMNEIKKWMKSATSDYFLRQILENYRCYINIRLS